MNTLIRSELKKIFTAKLFLFFFVLLLFFDVCTIVLRYGIYYSFSLQGDAESAIMRRTAFAAFEGELTEENLDQLNERISLLSEISDADEAAGAGIELITYTPGSDLMLYQNILTDMNRLRSYPSKMEEIRNAAKELQATAAERGNRYLYRVCDLTETVYNNRIIDRYYQTDGLEKYLSYDFSSFLIILMLLLGISPIMASEKEIGIFPLLTGTKNGRTALIYAKLVSTAVLTAIISFCFFAADIISFSVCLKPGGWDIPLFALPSYEYAIFTGSVFAFALLSMLIKYAGFLYLAVLIFLLSALLRKTYLVFICGFAIVTAFMLCKGYAGGALEMLNLINPISLLLPRELFGSFSVLRAANTPVYRWVVCAAICTVVVFVLHIAVVKLSKQQTEEGKWFAV